MLCLQESRHSRNLNAFGASSYSQGRRSGPLPNPTTLNVLKPCFQSVGSELSLHEVRQKYDEIRQGPEIKREETLHLVQQFFEADDVEVNAKKVSLICPVRDQVTYLVSDGSYGIKVSKRRIQDAVRGSRCRHIECFDLRSYLEYHTNLAYWECPFTFCREQVTCDQLRVDE